MCAAFTPAAPTSKVTQGVTLMILAILLFTTMDATAKGLIERYPAPQVVWARFAGQLLIVLVLLNIRAGPALRTRYPWLHMARSACQLGATGLFFLSLGHIGLAEATALTDINPVLITLGAAVFLGERLGPRRIIGVLVALAGALIIIRPGSGVFSPWALLPLGAAVCYTGNALLTRYIGPKEPVWTALLHASIFGTVLSAATLPFVWTPVAPAAMAGYVSAGVSVHRVQQVHGAAVVPASAATEEPWPSADGLVSDDAGQSLWVCGADCTPVLLADPASGRTQPRRRYRARA